MKSKQDDKLEHYESAHCEAEMELLLITERLQNIPAVGKGITWADVGSLVCGLHAAGSSIASG